MTRVTIDEFRERRFGTFDSKDATGLSAKLKLADGSVRMLEIVRTNVEQAQTPTFAPPVSAGAAAAAAETATSAIDRDREQLRRASAFADSETWLAAGVSTDVASLHQFVASLERSSLGLSAQLTSFETDRSPPRTKYHP